jgi:anti-sigma factor RsiW
MTNQCSQIQERLSAYHDRELSAEERRTIDGHLAGCSACAGELAAIAATSRLVSLSAVSARPGFEDRPSNASAPARPRGRPGAAAGASRGG